MSRIILKKLQIFVAIHPISEEVEWVFLRRGYIKLRKKIGTFKFLLFFDVVIDDCHVKYQESKLFYTH